MKGTKNSENGLNELLWLKKVKPDILRNASGESGLNRYITGIPGKRCSFKCRCGVVAY